MVGVQDLVRVVQDVTGKGEIQEHVPLSRKVCQITV